MNKSSFFPKVASQCETCHGAGVLPGRCREDELLPCPTCKGKGVITRKVSKKHVEERPCDNPNCKQGRVQQVQMSMAARLSPKKYALCATVMASFTAKPWSPPLNMKNAQNAAAALC